MSKYWSDKVNTLKPYIPGEQPKDMKYIKLNTNENPYPPSPNVLNRIKEYTNETLRLYPDPACTELTKILAEYYSLDKNQIFIGNGSDEVLAFSFMAFFMEKKPILFGDVTYSFYPVYAEMFGIEYNEIKLNDDFTIPTDEFLKDNGGVIIANPNAPTSMDLGLEKIEEVIKANKESVVIIDEAYVDFGGESAIGLIDKYPNLLVIQTLSKSRSLAGMRVGFAFGDKGLIEGLERVKNSINSYTLDRLALIAAEESIRDNDYFNETRNKIINTREWFKNELKRLNFKVLEPKGNFLFASHNDVRADIIFNELRKRGILVRYFNKDRIDNFLRISIGTDEEMKELVKELEKIL